MTEFNVVRAMTTDGGFRVIAADTTAMARQGAQTHGLSGSAAAMFGELLTGAVLLRETMSPAYRLQMNLQTSAGASLFADTHPGGLTRGIASVPNGQPLHFGADALLTVNRIKYGGELHKSVVSVSDVTGISHALMVYGETSEQVTATIGVACVDDPSGILHCGGYVVQLLPDPPEGPLMVMAERLADLTDLGALLARVGGVEGLVGELLYGMEYTVLDTTSAAWGCHCSQERVVGALATLGADEIGRIVADGEILEIDCDYCRTQYRVSPEQLRSLLVLS